MLALASGLRYIGSCSMSYPTKLIEEIIKFQRGYKVFLPGTGFELLPQGWEMRSLREFQKLSRTHLKRMFFIMTFKLAMQMNLQITLFIIRGVHQQSTTSGNNLFQGRVNMSALAGVLSTLSLIINFGSEFYDVCLIVKLSLKVHNAVKETVDTVDDAAIYAFDDFIPDEDQQCEFKRIFIMGREVKHEYHVARRGVLYILMVTLFCSWLIGYALLKFFMSFICKHGAWQFWNGCLEHHRLAAGAMS